MSLKRIFKIIDNGQIAIQLFDKETDVEGALNVLQKGFIEYESVCLAIGLNKPESRDGQKEIAKLVEAIFEDGITLVARHLPTNKIVGFAVNKINSLPTPGRPTFLEEFRKNNKLSEESSNKIKFVEYADNKINLFERFNTESFFELVFLSCLKEFRGRKVAHHLVENTVHLAREIIAGKYPETMAENLKGMKPKIVFAFFTSRYAARIGERFGMAPMERIPFGDLKAHGVPHPEWIPSEHTHCVLAAVVV